MNVTEKNKEIADEFAPTNCVWLIYTISDPQAEVLFITQIPAV